MLKKGISVLIVNWNTKSVIDQCLSELKKAIDYSKEQLQVEAVVVDNGSTDGSAEMISKKYPWTKLIQSKVNLGFAKGINRGFGFTDPKNDYLLLLNSDAYVQKDTLLRSVDYFEENKKCSVLGCRLQYQDGRLQPSAGYLPDPLAVIFWMMGIDKLPLVKVWFPGVHPRTQNFFAKERKVGWVQGAFVFMKRDVFEKTNGFDINFFMYMEEVEWFYRVKKLGYETFYSPGFFVDHLDKASAHGESENLIKIYSREVKGLLYYLRKYYPDCIWYTLPVMKFGVFMRFLAFSILGNRLRSSAYREILKEL